MMTFVSPLVAFMRVIPWKVWKIYKRNICLRMWSSWNEPKCQNIKALKNILKKICVYPPEELMNLKEEFILAGVAYVLWLQYHLTSTQSNQSIPFHAFRLMILKLLFLRISKMFWVACYFTLEACVQYFAIYYANWNPFFKWNKFFVLSEQDLPYSSACL